MHRFETTPGRTRPPWQPPRPMMLAARFYGLALVTASLAAPLHAQPASAALPASAPVAEASTLVTAFNVPGTACSTRPRCQALLQPWLGPRTLAELRHAALAVQARYNGESPAGATTGNLQFSTDAVRASPPGRYAVDGSGLAQVCQIPAKFRRNRLQSERKSLILLESTSKSEM